MGQVYKWETQNFYLILKVKYTSQFYKNFLDLYCSNGEIG